MNRTAPETPRAEAPIDEAAVWLHGIGRPTVRIVALPGDVSPRRYARVHLEDGGTAILATYPSALRATCERFLRATDLLAAAGVPVPRILAADCDAGLMLLEDLGPHTLADRKGRCWSELGLYFERAASLGRRIACLPVEAVADLNPPLSSELLRRELTQTWDLFLVPKGLTGDAGLTVALSAALDDLCARLGSGPLVPCHRDFMSRNLMPVDEQGGVAVLDHQDLRLGPAAYDLASLLNDTLFPPPELEDQLLAEAPFPRSDYHRAAAQRTLKAVGTYTSFALRGADRHLPLVAPTLARCLDHLARIPEGEALAGELARAWRPALGPIAP
jgi:aminoglycoside/choline kinase family phosphotransferase